MSDHEAVNFQLRKFISTKLDYLAISIIKLINIIKLTNLVLRRKWKGTNKIFPPVIHMSKQLKKIDQTLKKQ